MPLVDAYGREIQRFPTKPDLEMLAIVRVRDQWSSYPSSKLTPEKLASILREADAGDILLQSELAEEMEEKDPDLSSVLHTRKLAVQGLEYEVIPASDAAEDQHIADFVRKNLQDIDLDEPILDLLDAIFKGFAASWINWNLSEGQVWATGLEWIPQKRFTFLHSASNGTAALPHLPNLLTEDEPIQGVEVKSYNLLFHRYKARSGFIQRGGLVRPVSYYYLFKNYAWKDWLIFLEKYGQPTRIGKYSATASANDIAVLKHAVQNLGADAAAIISDTSLIELLEAKSSGASSDLYDKFVDRINKSYEKAVLGQTATTEGTPGKLGAEDAQSQVRHDLLSADAKALGKMFKSQLIWPMVGFNFGWDKMLPEFRFTVAEAEDLQALSLVHKILVDMGVPIPLSFIQKTYNIPAPQKGEALLVAPQSQSLGIGQKTGNGFALKKKVTVPIGSRAVRHFDASPA